MVGSGCELVECHHGTARRLAAQLQHRQQVVRRGAHVRKRSHLLCDHSQLLKVHQVLDARVVTQVDEGKVLLDDWVERDL